MSGLGEHADVAQKHRSGIDPNERHRVPKHAPAREALEPEEERRRAGEGRENGSRRIKHVDGGVCASAGGQWRPGDGLKYTGFDWERGLDSPKIRLASFSLGSGLRSMFTIRSVGWTPKPDIFLLRANRGHALPHTTAFGLLRLCRLPVRSDRNWVERR